MIIDNAGTYTLRYTATDDCGKTTTVDRELVVQNSPYGIYWDGSESSKWERTGKSASLAEPVPQHSDGNGGWTVGSSPFDDIMPWSGMQIVEDAAVGTLVSIPKYYYKWTHGLGNDGNGLRLEISSEPQDGFSTSPAHADRGDGVGERDVVYVGKYHCAGDAYKSQTGASPRFNKTRSAFRGYIHNLGSDIWQYDFAMYWTIAMLYLVEFADWNSQNAIGFGCGSSDNARLNGTTDAMPYHTGTNVANNSMTGQIKYRHIEGLWSSVFEFVDGIYFNGNDIYCINSPSDFSDTVNGTLIGEMTMTTSGAVPKKFTNPTINGYKYALYPTVGADSDYNHYVCDKWSNGGTVLFVGGSISNTNIMFGLFHFNGELTESSTSQSCGARLMKLPNA